MLDLGKWHCQKLTASYPARFAFGTKDHFKHAPIDGLQQQLVGYLKPEAGFLFEVKFDYAEQRSCKNGLARLKDYETKSDPERSISKLDDAYERKDKVSSNRSGFLVQTRRLCRRALVFHRLKKEEEDLQSKGYNGLVRSFEFHYHEDEYVAKLCSITQVNYREPQKGEPSTAGKYIARCMPPMEFVYSPMPNLAESRIQSADVSGLPNIPDGAMRDWTDINTDGAPGLLVKAHSGAWTYYRN